jgi:mRNA interferase MazF
MQKREIWLAKLPAGKGHEQEGTRPCLILGKSYGLVRIIPLTKSDDRANMAFTQTIDPHQKNGLTEISILLIFQITTISEERLVKRLGEITESQQETVDQLIKAMLKIK